MFKTLAVAGAFSMAAVAGHAASINIDFETRFAGHETDIDDPYTIGGVTFTRGKDQTVVKTGAPQDGFVPNDNIACGMFGDFFLTDDFTANQTVDLTLDFDGPVTGLQFYIGDIDGGGGNREVFEAVATLAGGGTSTISFTSGDAGTGNSIATLFDFGTDAITSVSISGSTANGNRIDNISATAVPLPAGAVLMLTGLAGLGLLRRRKG